MSEKDKVVVYASLGRSTRSLTLTDQLPGFRAWFTKIKRLPPHFIPEMEQSIRDAAAMQRAKEAAYGRNDERWARNLNIFLEQVTEAFQKERDARKKSNEA